jgi:integrase/recombinase XerD
MTDDEILESWLYGKAVGTAEYYERSARQFLRLMGKPLGSLNILDLQRYARDLEKNYPNPNTRRTVLSAIRSLVSYLLAIGILHDNPGKLLKMPRQTDTLSERIISEEEVGAILGQLEGDRLQFACFIYLTGCRVSELCKLRWKQVSISEGFISILGKGSRNRKIAITEDMAAILKYFWDSPSPGDLVFLVDGKAINRGQAWEWIKRATERAGINRPVSPHWFRHASATHSLDNGAAAHDVQRQLGHSSLLITSRYVHPDAKTSASAFLKLPIKLTSRE